MLLARSGKSPPHGRFGRARPASAVRPPAEPRRARERAGIPGTRRGCSFVPAGLRPGGAGVSPAGTIENSPPFQRWVLGSPSIPSPVGAKERSRPQGSFVPDGTRLVFWPLFPGINPWAILFRPLGWSGGKRFLRDSTFLRQHAGVKKRLLVVELYRRRDSQDEVASSR
jgi:hypothetical protein